MIPFRISRRQPGFPARAPRVAITLAAIAGAWIPAVAWADDAASPPQPFAIHAQATFEDQGTLSFHSPYRGAYSLDPGARGRETFDATLYAGVRLWRGAEVWITPEIDQGFGLSGTVGLAGFSSGEAYKVGKVNPYLRLQRAFLRQTFNLGGESSAVEGEAMHLRGRQDANRLVITVGKISVTDIFDTNDYAHDPRADFMNWSLIDTGSFDYAADAWGYTTGGAVEWYQGRWTVRAGAFNLSVVPNNEVLEKSFGQFQAIAEVEERHAIRGRAGTLKVTGFLSRGRMGRFDDAVALGEATGQTPSVANVRHYGSRTGISISLQQQVTGTLGVFARAGTSGGQVETYEFTDIDRTLAAGVSLRGAAWGRGADTVGFATVFNGISAAHRRYLAAGGLGILIGDGRLPHPGTEAIVETYYSLAPVGPVRITFDYQLVNNPAYNRDRGPASILAVRLHGQF